MLRDLHVRNLAVIVDAVVHFGSGLNVLTGETGAGKSIVVDSLALLSGARATSELIRGGAETLSVTGIFEPVGEGWREPIEEAGIEAGGVELVVRREINREGRNRVFLNDQPVTLNLLAGMAPQLIRIHTQREELGIVSPDLQRDWLDRSGQAEARRLGAQVREAFAEYDQLANRLARAEGDERLRQERIDLLRFQSTEIDTARLTEGEDASLKVERDALRHSEAIGKALGAAYQTLFEEEGAATERLSQAIRYLQSVTPWQPRSGDWVRELQSLSVGLEELARELLQQVDGVDADPARLDQLEDRLATIDRLTRKYGETCTDILEFRQQIGQELDDLTAGEEQREKLSASTRQALDQYKKAAAQLSAGRMNWARSLAERVHRELSDLAMPKARFEVELARRRRQGSPLMLDGVPVDYNARGYDQVVYQLAANPGEGMNALSRSASGGELSRIYLALQLAIRSDGPATSPTLVFDEVDAGIGGAEAAALGEKLARLAAGGQILAVTHLPQVASHADHHFRVEKSLADGRTQTEVVTLDRGERVREVARMLAGQEVTDLSLSHAEEMITTANRETG